jgi:hypothetical protein
VFPKKTLFLALFGLAVVACAQQPPVKVNVINVCTPPADDQKELVAALAKIPANPTFAKDFEVARGRTTLDPNTPFPGMASMPAEAAGAADWVRVRREFPNSAPFTNVQYSFSVDPGNLVETLVLRVRDSKDLIEVSIEDSASAVTPPAAMLAENTPAARIKLERFGKSSVVLSRCPAVEGKPAPDQSKYESIFREATAVLNRYRDALGVRKMVPQELARLHTIPSTKAGTARPKP